MKIVSHGHWVSRVCSATVLILGTCLVGMAAYTASSSGSARPQMTWAQLRMAATYMPLQSPTVFPLFLEGHGFDSTLVLANSTAMGADVEIRVRGLDGSQVATKDLTMPARSQARVPLVQVFGPGWWSQRIWVVTV